MGYDFEKYQIRRSIMLGDPGGASVAGTQASASELYRIRAPRALTVTAATIVALTGGTAAGPALVLGKSLGGTGTVAGFATHTFGTNANNTSAALTVTSTDFASGDHLVLQIAAGTAASTPKVNMLVEWIEDFS